MNNAVANYYMRSCTHPTIEDEEATFHFMTDGSGLWELQVWKMLGTLYWKGERLAGTTATGRFDGEGTYIRSGGRAATTDWTIDFSCGGSLSSSSSSSVSSDGVGALTDCADACRSYAFTIAGGSTLDGVIVVQRVSATCRWQDASNASWLSEVGGRWQLAVSGDTALIVMNGNDASMPPSTDPSDWVLTAYTDDPKGSPVLASISTSACAGSDSESSSSAIAVGCDFRRDAAGGNEGFNDVFDLSAAFAGDPSGVRTFYFDYQTFSIPDRFLITSADGSVVHHDSGCVGTVNVVTVPISLTLADSPIRVRMVPNCNGTTDTGWFWRATCEAPESSSGSSLSSPSSASSASSSSSSSEANYGCSTATTIMSLPYTENTETVSTPVGKIYERDGLRRVGHDVRRGNELQHRDRRTSGSLRKLDRHR